MSAICLIEESLDDLMRAALDAVFADGDSISPTKGQNRELRGVVLDPEGRQRLEGQVAGPAEAAEELGWQLAQQLLERGAKELLHRN